METPNPFALPSADVDEWDMPLRKAVNLGDVSYSSLKLREPTAAEWLLWDKLTGVEANVKAISTVAGVPEQVVKSIGVRSITAAAAFLDRFF